MFNKSSLMVHPGIFVINYNFWGTFVISPTFSPLPLPRVLLFHVLSLPFFLAMLSLLISTPLFLTASEKVKKIKQNP